MTTKARTAPLELLKLSGLLTQEERDIQAAVATMVDEHIRPNIAAYGEVSTIIGTMVQSVLLGQASPDQALSDAASQVDAALAGS